MPYVSNQGVRIHYRVEGSGPPLMLQAGWLSELERWYQDGYVEALQQNYQLILFDPRGRGASDKPHDRAAYTVEQRVGDVVAILDALDIRTTHFLGYSMGGVAGFELAKYAPERLRSLLLGGAHPYGFSFASFEGVDGTDLATLIPAFEAVTGEPITPAAQTRLCRNDLQAVVASASPRLPMPEVLPTMVMPCLLFVGEADTMYPQVQEAAHQLPKGTFVSFPGLKHLEVMSRRDLVLPHIMQFLQGVCEDRESAESGSG